MDSPTLDDDRLSLFGRIEKRRKLLPGFGSRIAFHLVQCTIRMSCEEALFKTVLYST